jgi:CxxC motif-containing protein (DUF1111 family)
MHRSRWILSGLAVAYFALGCTAEPKFVDNPTAPGDSTSEPLVVTVSTPGEALPGLTPRERALFAQGLQAFATPFTAATGLGPLFNSNSCAACHDDPALGGYGDSVEVHVTAWHGGSNCDELTANGGPVVQQHSTPELAALGILVEPMPAGLTGQGMRTTPLIFGLGLIDAVSDRTIKELARIRYPDGVHGRAAVLPNGRVGRFGRKAASASLDEFNAGAYFNEMGVTNSLNPFEGTIAGTPFGPGIDLAAEPEVDNATVAATSAFVRFLGNTPPAPLTEQTRFGRVLFYEARCTNCHIPVLRTGNSPVRALRNKWFRIYSDLLLHDMGPEEADICNGVASPSEFRTQPLNGMKFLDMFMHDGVSETIDQAVRRHGGEASSARARFLGMDAQEQAALVAFVQSL